MRGIIFGAFWVLCVVGTIALNGGILLGFVVGFDYLADGITLFTNINEVFDIVVTLIVGGAVSIGIAFGGMLHFGV